MARGRMLNAAITRDIKFNEMSIDAQFMFMRTLPFLDRDGLISGKVELLMSDIAPLLPQYYTKMAGIIQEWIDFEFVIKFKDGKNDVLFFPSFRKNQSGMRYEKESPSQFPVPPGYERTEDGLVEIVESQADSGKKTDDVLSASLVRTKDVVSLTELEEKRREGENTQARTHEDMRNAAPPLVLPKMRMSEGQATIVEAQPMFDPPSKAQIRAAEAAKGTTATTKVIPVEEGPPIIIAIEVWSAMLDKLLEGVGLLALAKAGVKNHKTSAGFVLETLCKMSERFRTVEGIHSVFASWEENDWRGETMPTLEQFREHASKMVTGRVVCERKDRQKQKQAATPEPVFVKPQAVPSLIDFQPAHLQELRAQ